MGIVVRQAVTTTSSRTVPSHNRKFYTRQNTIEDPLLEDAQIYVGENFIVKHGNLFNLRRKVCSQNHPGVVFTELRPLKPVL